MYISTSYIIIKTQDRNKSSNCRNDMENTTPCAVESLFSSRAAVYPGVGDMYSYISGLSAFWSGSYRDIRHWSVKATLVLRKAEYLFLLGPHVSRLVRQHKLSRTVSESNSSTFHFAQVPTKDFVWICNIIRQATPHFQPNDCLIIENLPLFIKINSASKSCPYKMPL